MRFGVRVRAIGVTVIAAVFASLAFSHSASAHVLITDTSETKGAILHIAPDDSPIAGQQATLFLNTQNALLTKKSNVSLTITNTTTRASDTVKVTSADDMAIADYTFPTQGVYALVFRFAAEGIDYEFSHTQRISRGVMAGTVTTERHQWAEMLLVGSVVGAGALVIIVVNRRKEIARQSTF